MVTATFPDNAAESLREPLKEAVLSTRWAPDVIVSQFEGLPFRVTETQSLKVANRMANLLLLTEGGSKGVVAASDPLLVVGASLSEVPLRDVEEFARGRIAQTDKISGLTNLRGQARTVHRLPAYELTGDAVDQKTGTPLAVYQLVVADDHHYFLIQGLVGQSRAAEFMPQFREIGDSLRKSR